MEVAFNPNLVHLVNKKVLIHNDFYNLSTLYKTLILTKLLQDAPNRGVDIHSFTKAFDTKELTQHLCKYLTQFIDKFYEDDVSEMHGQDWYEWEFRIISENEVSITVEHEIFQFNINEPFHISKIHVGTDEFIRNNYGQMYKHKGLYKLNLRQNLTLILTRTGMAVFTKDEQGEELLYNSNPLMEYLNSFDFTIDDIRTNLTQEAQK